MERCCGGMVVMMSLMSFLASFSGMFLFFSDLSGGRYTLVMLILVLSGN
jgi:hypothetical protein